MLLIKIIHNKKNIDTCVCPPYDIISDAEREEIVKGRGTQFDPELHEAIAALPSDKPDGEILDVAVAGYMLRDKVLRHAKVAVSTNNP